ncbi:MAG: S9 family peptidase [Acidobacteria bacterium]|nr:S9 family peptidase [Acidobacteriota bacterium]
MRRFTIFAISVTAMMLTVVVSPSAQLKPTVTPADYGQFESLSRGSWLSPNGQWLAYGLSRVGGNNELRVVSVPVAGAATPEPHVVPFGTQAVFSQTSEWLAYAIGQSEAEQDRLRRARRPIHRALGLLHLPTLKETRIDDVESFAFDATGQSLAMKRYAPVAAGAAAAAPAGRAGGGVGGGRGGGAGAPEAGRLGTTLVVRALASGLDMTFGNVSEYAWQDDPVGRRLAMVISADGKAGNGIHLFDTATSVLRVLASSEADYATLAWRKNSADLAALRSKNSDTHSGPTQVALAWTSLSQPTEAAHVLDATLGALATTQRLVTFRRPTWLDVGAGRDSMIMLGVADWEAKPEAPSKNEDEDEEAPASTPEPETADVDVWHWTDTVVMSRQKQTVEADRRRNQPAVWHLTDNRLVVVGRSFDEQVSPIEHTTMALVSEYTPYLMDRSIGRSAADLWLADLSTGDRTLLKAAVTGRPSVSPAGTHVIYGQDGHYWTINLATKAVTNITAKVRTSFVDTKSDSTAPEKPMFGLAGWTAEDRAVVAYDAYDLWRLAPDGSAATRLTQGAAEQVRHRYVHLNPDVTPVDVDHGYVSLFGDRSKKSGYGQLASTGATRLVWLDKSVNGLFKAEDTDVFAYTVQGADDSPDLFTAGAQLTTETQVTATNPFLANYAWGRSELVEYTVQPKGQPKMTLQGSLYYPANYDPGRKYPMVVYLYEQLSDDFHRFTPPDETDYYNGTTLTQQGYFFFQPDIVFQPREPGVSVVECVTAAVKRVIELGVVDASKVGVMGHSWGGFDAMYLATHSTLFAAAVSGAGISNLISNYGNHHWSSGIAETDHIETGQQRMVVPLYEDLPAYIRNSAVFGVSTMTTPLLLMTGDNDGTVYWHQSVELYNIARRAKKNVVMLVYNNEDHGLRVEKNQIDYHRRIRAWFAHYLRGESAPEWVTAGVSALQRPGRD